MSTSGPTEPYFAEGFPQADGRRIGVLLSHGFTGSPASIVPWGRHLADEGYAVSVPLLPGHGTTWQDMVPTRWEDWTEAIEKAYDDLAARCDAVVVGGLSMGGALALQLAQAHPEIRGLVMVNPAINSTNKQLLALPVLKHLLKAVPGIANDIKRDGVAEHGYDKTPLKPLASMKSAWSQLRADLPKVTCPVLLFRSVEDHVVDPTSGKLILAGLSSRDVTERLLHDSYHVATLDNDAPQIYAESTAFVERVTASS